MDFILKALNEISPKIKEMLSSAIMKQQKTLFAEKSIEGNTPIIAKIWEWFVIGMVAYFIYSIINSLVQNYL